MCYIVNRRCHLVLFWLGQLLAATLWSEWKDSPPADHIARSYLKVDRGLNEQAARTLLGIYKDNLEFAKVKGSDKVPEQPMGDLDGLNQPKPPADLPQKPGLTVMEGERELTTGMLSKGASFRLVVRGPVGVKEIEHLIKKLELDKEILAENNDVPETKQ